MIGLSPEQEAECRKLDLDYLQGRCQAAGLSAKGPKADLCRRLIESGNSLEGETFSGVIVKASGTGVQLPLGETARVNLNQQQISDLIKDYQAKLDKLQPSYFPPELSYRQIGLLNLARRKVPKYESIVTVLTTLRQAMQMSNTKEIPAEVVEKMLEKENG